MKLKLSSVLFFAAVLTACTEPRPSGTGGNGSTGTTTVGSTTGGASTTGGSTGGVGTGGSSDGGLSTTSSGGSTGGAGSTCSRPQECASGVCMGHCCQSACKLDDPTGTCVPTACGTDGSCTYPGSTIACGGGCDANNQFTRTGSCRGDGTCSQTTMDCGLFKCASSGCPPACSDSTACIPGASCFLAQRVCCTTIAPGATLYVDGAIGLDSPCCGATAGTPCHTLTAAMNEIESSHATGVTISAAVNGSTGDWTAPETWPVNLHLGVTLHAPGVYFFVPDVLSTYQDVFEVKPFDANDRLPVIIEGDLQFFALVGFDSKAGQYTGTDNAVYVSGLTLKLGSVWLSGSNAGINVGDNGTLEIDGFVQIGYYLNASTSAAVVSYDGIVCGGSGPAATATVVDPGAADGDLAIQGQSNADIHGYSYCTVNLQHVAILGVTPLNGSCPVPKPDSYGVYAEGDPLSITLNTPVIECMDSDGVDVASGNPIVTLMNPTVEHCGCYGLSTFAGVLYSGGGTIRSNHWGALQGGGQMVLSGNGGMGLSGGNIIGCNTEYEPGYCYKDGYPGVDVENDSLNAMDADNCFLDHAPPSELSCMDDVYGGCSCVSTTTCPTSPDYDGIDLVVIKGGGAISTKNVSGNGLGCQ